VSLKRLTSSREARALLILQFSLSPVAGVKQVSDVEHGLQLDRRSGSEVIAFAEHRANLLARDLTVDVGVGAGRLDDRDLGRHPAIALGDDVEVLGANTVDNRLAVPPRCSRVCGKPHPACRLDPDLLAVCAAGCP